MLEKVLIGGLVAGALSFGMPVAHAAPAVLGCRYVEDSPSLLATGGDIRTGVVAGAIVSGSPANPVSVRCYFTVDGDERASTPRGEGIGAAVTADYLVVAADPGQDLDLCTEWTDGGDSGTACADVAGPGQVPPQEVIDLLDLILAIPDAIVCPVLAALAPGVPGIVDIDSEGDVTAAEPVGWLWDCPPYGS